MSFNMFDAELPVNPTEKQQLKNTVGQVDRNAINNDIWRGGALPAEYVQKVVVPALRKVDERQLMALNAELKDTHTKLSDLVAEVVEQRVYVSKDGDALPVPMTMPEKARIKAKSAKDFMGDAIADVANSRDVQEQEAALLGGIIASANRSYAKFDQYVIGGDGKQWWDQASEWLEFDSLNRDIKRPSNDDVISHDVENVSKKMFAGVLNDVVAMAKDPGNTVTIEGGTHPFPTRLEKLKYLASWMSALEEGCDQVLWSLPVDAAAKVGWTAWDMTGGLALEGAGRFYNDNSILINSIGLLVIFAGWKTGNLIKGILKIPSLPFHVVAGGAKLVPGIRRLAPGIEKFANFVDFSGWVSTPTADGTTTTPETPRRFVPVSPQDFPNFTPGSTGENSHMEYRDKTIAEIQKLTSATPAVSTREMNRRLVAFRRLDAEYTKGSLSTAEYFARTEMIIRGEGALTVRAEDGKLKKGASVKRAATEVVDRIPLVDGRIAAANESVSAASAAKKRVKGVSYSAPDMAGNEVKFETPEARALFEEFRDKVQKYAQMQEWDANDRKRAQLTAREAEITGTEIPAKNTEIGVKAAQLAAEPHTIPGAPIAMPGAAPVPTQIPNPMRDTLNRELSQLQEDLKWLNNEVRGIRTEIAKIRGNAFAYAPTGGNRADFSTDIRAMKTDIVDVIKRINEHIAPRSTSGAAGAPAKPIPDSFFDPKNMKIEPKLLVDRIGKALKK